MKVILVDKDHSTARSFTLGAFSRVILSICLLGIPTFVGAFGYSFLITQEQLINKKNTQDQLKAIIANDGNLRSIKHALLSQTPDFTLSDALANNKNNYYPQNIPLSSVLEDIKINALINQEKSILSKIDLVISEHEETNPFDKLQNSQRDLFVNIRIKSEEDYSKISNDINNIADELHSKNQLVDEYLSDSKTSYWVSILGLLFSLIIGSTQIYWQLSSKKYEVKVEEENTNEKQTST